MGTILLMATLLLGLYAGRGYLGRLSWKTGALPPPPVFVEVTGEVAHPGVYAFPAPPTLPDAWRRAGGPEWSPLPETRLPSQTRLEVEPGGGFDVGRISGERLLTLGLALDLNTASAADLEALPGVGPVLAQRIVQYRESQGPYKKFDDLLAVHGLGKKKLALLRPLLTIPVPPE